LRENELVYRTGDSEQDSEGAGWELVHVCVDDKSTSFSFVTDPFLLFLLYELIGDDDGVFGCMSLLACHDVCPKDLPLQTQIAFLRRKMLTTAL
jgi:hypothetical protein